MPASQDVPEEVVANKPRLFVGAIGSATEDELLSIFSPFGVVRALNIVRRGDGTSQGCAMIQFDRWSEAEAALEAVDGSTALQFRAHASRPLVCKVRPLYSCTSGDFGRSVLASGALYRLLSRTAFILVSFSSDDAAGRSA
jgi:RNA recognition motif-containing protein